ncbi:MAG: hypothetical protein HWN68_19010 [Desulfobacterales bacterium]|nr:hypothetical protein [Desulfobacterales bacterium]
MTHRPIMIKVIDEVVPDASFDREFTDKVISTCSNCGSIVFYRVVEYNYEGSEHATDTCIYCAVCGQIQSGYTSDPFDELESLKVGEEWWRKLDWNTLPKVWEQLPSPTKRKIEKAGLAPGRLEAKSTS